MFLFITDYLFSGQEASLMADMRNILWVFCRRLSSSISVQEVPGWSGFVSVTGGIPTSTTTIDYYSVINNPITDYKTVQQCLEYAESVSREVGQDFVITIFDLGVCMKVYPLTWNNPPQISETYCHDWIITCYLGLFGNVRQENERYWFG